MTHPQFDPNIGLIESITFRNYGYGYLAIDHVSDLSQLLIYYGIDHSLDFSRDDYGYSYPTLVIRSDSDMELIKSHLQKRLIQVNIYRSKS